MEKMCVDKSECAFVSTARELVDMRGLDLDPSCWAFRILSVSVRA